MILKITDLEENQLNELVEQSYRIYKGIKQPSNNTFDMEQEFCTVAEAATRYDFSQCQIHALAINRKIKHKIAYGQVLVNLKSLDKFVKNNPLICEIMQQRTSGDCAFYHFLGVYENENGQMVKA